MFLTLSLLGILYVGCVIVMISGLASAQPETPRDAALAEQLRHQRALEEYARHGSGDSAHCHPA